MLPEFEIRLAIPNDIPALTALVQQAVRILNARDYDPQALEAALGQTLGIDLQLIADGTYFVAETAGEIVACGGWSRRKALYGVPDQADGDVPVQYLDPATDQAKIRAFYVHPRWSRRGLGRRLLLACERAAWEAGFTRLELLATLTGEPLYAACGYTRGARINVPLAGGYALETVMMTKKLSGDPSAAERQVA